MTKILNDTRKFKAYTEADADNTLGLIATMEADVAKTTAIYEKKIAALKNECQDKLTPLKEVIDGLALELCGYIGANKNRFLRPRARVTSHGKYGLRKVSNVTVTDQEAVANFSDEMDLGLYEIKKKLDTRAARALLDDEVKVPGARLAKGEETFYKVEKRLLDEARQNILS